MIEEGAAIIDVGAMATGPRSTPVTLEREMEELIPAVKAISRKLGVPISADTQRAEVARAAIEAGAEIINDISGLKGDAQMAETIARAGCSTIIMATERLPGDVFEIDEIKMALDKSLKICREHGIPSKKVVVDPAVGYWPGRMARLGQRAYRLMKGGGYRFATFVDLRILARLREIDVGRPICVGVSRKTFIGDVLKLDNPDDRLVGSLAAAALAVANGAHAIRTHDPIETLQASRMAEAIMSASR
jgi:dihydropteroate synthase